MSALHSTFNLVEAQALSDHLAANGVRARVSSDELLPGGPLPYPAAAYGVHLLRAEDEAKAAALLQEFLRAPPADPEEIEQAALAAPEADAEPMKPVAAAAAVVEQPRRGLWIELLVVLCLGHLPFLAYGIAGYIELLQTGEELAHDWSLAQGFAQLQVIVPVLFIMGRSGEGWRHFGLGRVNWAVDAQATIAALLFGLLELDGTSLLFHRPGTAADAPAADDGALPGAAAYATLILSVLAGAFQEELVMRGYLIPRLRALTRSPVIAVLASSALFASYHIYQGVEGLVGTFVFGLGYGIFFCLVGRIWPLVAAHALHNILMGIAHLA